MLALTNDWLVYSWGYGGEGQCGNGTNMNVKTPQFLFLLFYFL